MEKYFPSIKVKKEKVIVLSSSITIPSDLYPLQNKKRIRLFSTANTAVVESETLRDVFNSLELPPGRCYSNTLAVYKRLLENGVPERDVETYVGWIVINNIPIHHCWLVYKDMYVLDGGVSSSDVKYYQEIQASGITDKEEQRHVLFQFMEDEKGKPNSETKTFGLVSPLYLYVGSKALPTDGATWFTRLMEKYPNHPSYANEGMNGQGMSRMQELLYQKR